MARKENPELRARLQAEVERLLRAEGLAATTYRAVADAAGVSRAVVQYYYPRKMDFAVEFLEKLLAAAADLLGLEGYSRGKGVSPAEAHRMGCLYYGFLLAEDGARLMLLDILKDRELADELMLRHYEWALKNVDPRQPAYDWRSEDVIVAWGGFYELMYRSAKAGLCFDVSTRLVPVIGTFVGEGESDGALGDACSDSLDPELLEELKSRVTAS